ncbi:MAG TPA: ABC transporter ATP-binding protein [Propionibacteriaceae bacterium]|nr:ABC transporter ATP-binding protein [Propionibacteriaceae bacterium]
MALLEVQDLHIRYEPKRHAPVDAVSDVSFAIEPGEFVGLIGESGSGKTTLGMALLRLLERPGRIAGGKVVFDGTDITTLDQDELRQYRWTDIATVFQGSMNSLNPVVRVEGQFRDVIEYHTDLRGEAVLNRIKTLFDMVFIEHKFITAYPHELSGGMKQRVNLALALAIEPRFVLLDEPTTGLDVVVQHNILENVRKLQTELGFAVLFISHDIGAVLDLSDRILVMYAGKIVEERQADLLLRDPMHPYGKGLLGSYGDPRDETVRITYVPGRPPDLAHRPVGCSFAPRCPEKIARCLTIEPPLEVVGNGRVACHVAKIQRSDALDGADEVGPITRMFIGPQFVKSASESEVALDRETVLTVENVSKTFTQRRGTKVTKTEAVKNASFVLHRGGVTALVGQSGSGKSTLARMITGVDRPTSGTITFHGSTGDVVVGGMRGRRLRDYRSQVQMVFQDPYSSLNPAKTLGYILSRPLMNYKGLRGAAVRDKVTELLETVALTPASRYVNRFAYELSGGQRQRVVIARALAVEPELIIADEPISSLDVSIRAEVLELLNKLVHERDVGILYITHDLLSARMLSDEVVVLNGGQIVEQGPSLEVIRNPQDEYTQLLLDAIPNPFDEVDPAQPRRSAGPTEPLLR